MKVSKLLYDSLSIDYINKVFENQEYIKENDKNLNIGPGEVDKVSYNKFKNIYHQKIVDFLNMHITKQSKAFIPKGQKIFKADDRPLGLLSKIPDVLKLRPKKIPGINKKIEVFNVKDLVQGVSAIDLNKFSKNQQFHFMLKDSDETIVGAESSSGNESIYIISIPPVLTEIKKENINALTNEFKNSELLVDNEMLYYKEYTKENVSYKTCSNSDDEIKLFQSAAYGTLPILNVNKIFQIKTKTKNRGTKNEKVDSED